MRPLYESSQDIVSESKVLILIEKAWRCRGVKLPLKAQLDYLLLRHDRGVAWAEIKVRTNPRGRYPTYMISLSKVMAARELAGASNLPSVLIVQWTDSLGYIRMDTLENFHIAIGGRTDRNDTQDIEPVVLIPIDDFRGLNEA